MSDDRTEDIIDGRWFWPDGTPKSMGFSYLGVSFETPQGHRGSVRSGNGEVYLLVDNLLSFGPDDAKAIAEDIIEATKYAYGNVDDGGPA